MEGGRGSGARPALVLAADSGLRAGAGGPVAASPGRGWPRLASPCSAPGLREMASPLPPAAPAIVSPGVA